MPQIPQQESELESHHEHTIERLFCRIKDWRRVATRFDRNIKNFMAVIALAATVIWWLK